MRRDQKLSGLIRNLARFLDEEAAKNPQFAERLDALLTPARLGSTLPRGRRPPDHIAIPDVFSMLEAKGEEEFRFWLRTLDIATFKAIVKANGFDVARSSQKWADPDKFINLIAEQTRARLRRGAGFLSQSTNSKEPRK